MTDVTQILSQIEQVIQSLPSSCCRWYVYDEMRKLAAPRLANEKPGRTLQATVFVHEAYMRLVDVDKVDGWKSRAHFFGAAAASAQLCPATPGGRISVLRRVQRVAAT